MNIPDNPSSIAFDPVMSRAKAAEYLNMSLRSLDDLFAKGGGPVRSDTLGGKCGYRLSSLNAWLETRARKSSADATVQRAEKARATSRKAKAERQGRADHGARA
ncbi:MAG: hypothetical protein HIU90_07415 [Proteobacteria bacterium]|nr:hypothetical protein [Pseudomonadota bacterium]